MNLFRCFAGLITFFLIICATIIHGAKDFLFPTEIMLGSECISNSVCLASNMCNTLTAKIIKQSRPQICGWNGNKPMVCCPRKFERIVDRSECATFENIQPRIRVKRQPPIAFGVDAKQGSWPWMAAIFVKQSLSRKAPFCGGSLISRNTVLTAAHCFINSDGRNKYVVVLGDLKLGDDIDGPWTNDGLTPVEVDVSSVISHEGYKYPSVYNDIAILKLATAVNITPNIRMICLPDVITMRNFNLNDKNATITGWGHLGFGGRAPSALQEASVPIVTNSQCEEAYRHISSADSMPNGITKNIICAGGVKDSCQGDSGGPLAYKHENGKVWILVGIVSSGFECGRGIPGIYTRVSEYMDWIRLHI